MPIRKIGMSKKGGVGFNGNPYKAPIINNRILSSVSQVRQPSSKVVEDSDDLIDDTIAAHFDSKIVTKLEVREARENIFKALLQSAVNKVTTGQTELDDEPDDFQVILSPLKDDDNGSSGSGNKKDSWSDYGSRVSNSTGLVSFPESEGNSISGSGENLGDSKEEDDDDFFDDIDEDVANGFGVYKRDQLPYEGSGNERYDDDLDDDGFSNGNEEHHNDFMMTYPNDKSRGPKPALSIDIADGVLGDIDSASLKNRIDMLASIMSLPVSQSLATNKTSSEARLGYQLRQVDIRAGGGGGGKAAASSRTRNRGPTRLPTQAWVLRNDIAHAPLTFQELQNKSDESDYMVKIEKKLKKKRVLLSHLDHNAKGAKSLGNSKSTSASLVLESYQGPKNLSSLNNASLWQGSEDSCLVEARALSPEYSKRLILEKKYLEDPSSLDRVVAVKIKHDDLIEQRQRLRSQGRPVSPQALAAAMLSNPVHVGTTVAKIGAEGAQENIITVDPDGGYSELDPLYRIAQEEMRREIHDLTRAYVSPGKELEIPTSFSSAVIRVAQLREFASFAQPTPEMWVTARVVYLLLFYFHKLVVQPNQQHHIYQLQLMGVEDTSTKLPESSVDDLLDADSRPHVMQDHTYDYNYVFGPSMQQMMSTADEVNVEESGARTSNEGLGNAGITGPAPSTSRTVNKNFKSAASKQPKRISRNKGKGRPSDAMDIRNQDLQATERKKQLKALGGYLAKSISPDEEVHTNDAEYVRLLTQHACVRKDYGPVAGVMKKKISTAAAHQPLNAGVSSHSSVFVESYNHSDNVFDSGGISVRLHRSIDQVARAGKASGTAVDGSVTGAACRPLSQLSLCGSLWTMFSAQTETFPDLSESSGSGILKSFSWPLLRKLILSEPEEFALTLHMIETLHFNLRKRSNGHRRKIRSELYGHDFVNPFFENFPAANLPILRSAVRLKVFHPNQMVHTGASAARLCSWARRVITGILAAQRPHLASPLDDIQPRAARLLSLAMGAANAAGGACRKRGAIFKKKTQQRVVSAAAFNIFTDYDVNALSMRGGEVVAHCNEIIAVALALARSIDRVEVVLPRAFTEKESNMKVNGVTLLDYCDRRLQYNTSSPSHVAIPVDFQIGNVASNDADDVNGCDEENGEVKVPVPLAEKFLRYADSFSADLVIAELPTSAPSYAYVEDYRFNFSDEWISQMYSRGGACGLVFLSPPDTGTEPKWGTVRTTRVASTLETNVGGNVSRFVVCVNDSPASETAVNLAMSVAKPCDNIFLVHVAFVDRLQTSTESPYYISDSKPCEGETTANLLSMKYRELGLNLHVERIESKSYTTGELRAVSPESTSSGLLQARNNKRSTEGADSAVLPTKMQKLKSVLLRCARDFGATFLVIGSSKASDLQSAFNKVQWSLRESARVAEQSRKTRMHLMMWDDDDNFLLEGDEEVEKEEPDLVAEDVDAEFDKELARLAALLNPSNTTPKKVEETAVETGIKMNDDESVIECMLTSSLVIPLPLSDSTVEQSTIIRESSATSIISANGKTISSSSVIRPDPRLKCSLVVAISCNDQSM